MAIFIGCSENEEDEISNGLKDSRDGQTYKVVIIGSQVWMAENLNFDTGDGSWVYADKLSNSDIYGRLYDWETACNVCPDGWHLPTYEEWSWLNDYLDGGSAAGQKLIDVSNPSLWIYFDQKATNETGFSALPGGKRNLDGSYNQTGQVGYWWSSTSIDSQNASNVLITNTIGALLAFNESDKKRG